MTGTAERPSRPRRGILWLLGLAAFVNLMAAALITKQVYLDRAIGNAGASVPDFTAFWAAGRMALDGRAALAWDWDAHKAVEVAGLGHDFPGWMAWHYPPLFQSVLAPFGAFSLPVAMVAWVVLTGGLYLWVAWRVLPGPLSILITLASAPTMLGLVNGQTGFLIGALTGLALLRHEDRPVASGLALGALAIKPQLAIAFPVLLALTGRWRMFGGAVAGVLALIVLSVGLLGIDAWRAFIESMTRSGDAFAGKGLTVKWDMFASFYGGLRNLGFGLGVSLILHGALALTGLAMAVQGWRSPATVPAVRAALACYATVLVTPRVLNYDLTILVIGVLFQLRAARVTGLLAGETGAIAAALLILTAGAFMPSGLVALAAPILLGACWRRRVPPKKRSA